MHDVHYEPFGGAETQSNGETGNVSNVKKPIVTINVGEDTNHMDDAGGSQHTGVHFNET